MKYRHLRDSYKEKERGAERERPRMTQRPLGEASQSLESETHPGLLQGYTARVGDEFSRSLAGTGTGIPKGCVTDRAAVLVPSRILHVNKSIRITS